MRDTVVEFDGDFETDEERSLSHFLNFVLILLTGFSICASTVVFAVMVRLRTEKIKIDSNVFR